MPTSAPIAQPPSGISPPGPSGEPQTEPSPTIRHNGSITLTLGGNEADLDSPSRDPQWQTGGKDIHYDPDTLDIGSPSLYLGKTPANYSTCRTTTGYRTTNYNPANFDIGDYFCVETDEHRFSAIRITDSTKSQIVIDVTTYDPPES
jgi:hypothetical protein